MLQFLFYINIRYIIEVQLNISFELLMILQRYTFGSKSQPTSVLIQSNLSCLWYCKDIHLEANHNDDVFAVNYNGVAYDIAKIYIWKQITTLGVSVASDKCCLWYCKDIHLEANHNNLQQVQQNNKVAYDIAKIYIWKQITT